jgi:hypothetical protein
VAAKDVPTTCADACDTLTSSACTVTTTHDDIVAGSDIDCTSARTITVDGGILKVHDGYFTLRGKDLTTQRWEDETQTSEIEHCPSTLANWR